MLFHLEWKRGDDEAVPPKIVEGVMRVSRLNMVEGR